MTRRRIPTALLAGALALALPACGGDDDGGGAAGGAGGGQPGATTDKVEVVDFTYKPETITVKAGTTVTWTFQDDAPHNVEPKGSDAPKLSPDLVKGGTYTFTFPTAGTFEYRCGLHNYMTGTVKVTA